MNVVVSNVFPDHNKGGALLTQATVRMVRRWNPQAAISLLLVKPAPEAPSLRHTLSAEPGCTVLQPPFAGIAERFGGATAALAAIACLIAGRAAGRWHDALRVLAQADLVVSKGGHVFVERRGVRGLVSLWITAFPLLYGARCGAATVASGATVGPFRSRRSRLVNRFILKRVDVVMPRDGGSVKNALELGLDARRVRNVPDGVFADSTRVDRECQEPLLQRYGVQPGGFGVVTTGYAAGDERAFVNEVGACIRTLCERGVVDQVLIPLHVLSPTGESADRPLSERLVEELHPVRARIVDDDLSPAELLSLYRAALFVTGRRLHSTLFGLVVGTPSVPIVHPSEPLKARMVFEDLGLGARVAETSIPDQLLAILDQLLANRQDASQTGLAAVDAQRAHWRDAVDQAADLVVRAR